jgi:GAF domain-containing protein
VGGVSGIERLGCEVLPNGTVIARDAARGTGYVIQPAIDAAQLTVESTEEHEFALAGEASDDLSDVHDAEDVTQACEAALTLAQELVDAESGCILLERDHRLEFVAVFGPRSDTLLGVEVPLDAGVAGHAVAKNRSVVLSDAAGDPRHFGEVDALIGNRTREIAVIPISDERKVYGVLELLNLPPGQRFRREDLQRLQQVARALAQSLAKKR